VNVDGEETIPVMKAFDAETFEAVEHVPVVFLGEEERVLQMG
jgi:hypothetical protein